MMIDTKTSAPKYRRLPLILLAAALLLSTVACRTATQSAQVAPEAPPAEESMPAKEEMASKEEMADKEEMAGKEEMAEKEAAPAKEEPYSNTIKWSTASELDNFGFDVFRGDSAEGPFKRLNAETIEGAGTSDEPHNYRFTDDTIDPYRTYYYYVESISMNGEREKFTPVGRAKPKLTREEEAGSEDDGSEGDGE